LIRPYRAKAREPGRKEQGGRSLAAGWDLKQLEQEYIRTVVKHTDGHKGNAARILGIDRRTLYRKLDALGSDRH